MIATHNNSQLLAVHTTTTEHQQQQQQQTSVPMIRNVSNELEAIRCGSHRTVADGVAFPMACRSMLYNLPGNSYCADCGAARPEWASVSYGILLCVRCSGRHRSFGVQISRVRSIDMDAWSHSQIMAMLEGGNEQLTSFFDRHGMSGMMDRRYQTKAALFYRSNLQKHVETVANAGEYKGREAARRRYHQQSKEKIHQTVACSKAKTATVQ
ncbi:with coiled-coil, ANK repeat and PH domain-containing protein [Seminavis robusta]|uniref:With coiled-coil, ANK repeat and PH domain-containing protein n=1 Tax=Seminavis robusta TaxID=568900 RepID=A0A9N8DJ44_9STRA|nr:with coiled-coil, ANK repeat and PH domain-containing protein [Seminavis robusta]|eukprot:Sro180_g078800.1 with coiled-coil, ANK repeat and PH domain-containing protein (211) ;mRNA; r:60225-60857